MSENQPAVQPERASRPFGQIIVACPAEKIADTLELQIQTDLTDAIDHPAQSLLVGLHRLRVGFTTIIELVMFPALRKRLHHKAPLLPVAANAEQEQIQPPPQRQRFLLILCIQFFTPGPAGRQHGQFFFTALCKPVFDQREKPLLYICRAGDQPGETRSFPMGLKDASGGKYILIVSAFL